MPPKHAKNKSPVCKFDSEKRYKLIRRLMVIDLGSLRGETKQNLEFKVISTASMANYKRI